MPPCLVLHADDLGMNRFVTDGILEGFRHGVLTAASLLANAPDARRAASRWLELSRDHEAGLLPSTPKRRRLGDSAKPFDIGVHLNLTQGSPLDVDCYPSELLDSDGHFPGVFALFTRLRRHGGKYVSAIRAELERQIVWMLDHGLWPTHLNGHQYIEMLPTITPIVVELAERFDVRVVRSAWEPGVLRTTALHRFGIVQWPLALLKRRFAIRFRAELDRLGIAHPDAFFGTSHAGRIDLQLVRLFLKSGRGHRLVEIAVHPGRAAEGANAIEQRAEPTEHSDFCAAENAMVSGGGGSKDRDGWRDPLAVLRPNELEMLISDALPPLLEAQGWRLGRLAAPAA